ncbi:bifunctional methylenetetrahydrofolate dehydrogenase/methenyltetrahydrofolate cyclohydrolase FolD [Thermoproteota archaeon]
MSALILNGQEASRVILDGLKKEITGFKKELGRVPGLSVILTGHNPGSESYVNMKKKATDAIGIQSKVYKLDAKAGEDEIARLIHVFNQDDDVHGILLQLPLPQGYDERKLLDQISPEKDVDGFHPINVGRMLLGIPSFRSCTPLGILHLLNFYNISAKGKHVVIIGRSNIVGKPLAALLIQKDDEANATVTICHSHTKQLGEISKRADIIVAAMGQPRFITADMVKEGAVVIDVGINRISDPSLPKGYRVVGDVDFDSVVKKVSAISPVPKGVGPMTIAMLMKNTVESFKNSL